MTPAFCLTAWAILALSAGMTDKHPAEAAKNVRVSVVVIVASEKDRTVDPKLRCIADEVRKIYPRLKGFKLAKMVCKSIPVNTRETFPLIDDQKAVIVIERGADKDNRVQVRVDPPLLGEITYSTPCGKFLPIVTRYRPNKHELLLLAVRVQPCNGK